MTTPPLGRLTRVTDLRAYWASEAAGFTPWLAQPENIKLLADVLGLELEVEAQEKDVGPFRADILCKETNTGHYVLVENQLERTDHTHLGQLLTYAAGLDAVTIVWIATQFTAEHRAALDWLNRVTGESINFFGIEIELWRIGDSPAAPKFNLASQPNEWGPLMRVAETLSEARQGQLAFWIAFRAFMEQRSRIRCQRPAPQHYMSHPIGRSGFGLSSIAAVWSPEGGRGEIGVELVINDRHAKEYFAQLEAQRPQIESELGHGLTWNNPPNALMCRVFVRRPADIRDRAKWTDYHEWLLTTLEAFKRVFGPRVLALRIDAEPAEQYPGDDAES